MNKDTPIIPFPRRNKRKLSAIRQRQQTMNTGNPRVKPSIAVGSASVVINISDNGWSQMTDIHALMKEQCDVLVHAMQALVEYAEKNSEETVGKLQATWKRSDALKQRHLDMFKRTSTTTNDYNGIFRASVTLDMAIDCTKATTDHILDMGMPADRFMLEMAVENKTWAQMLQRGFYKLTTDPFLAKEDAYAAHRAKHNAERIYRHALAELVGADETVYMRKADRENSKAKPDIFGIYERRRIYYHFLKCAKRLVWAANSLREIASRSATHRTPTKEPIG